ncbi:MAG: CgeB family protein, partial [Fusobacteriaceae bacterium]
MKYNKKIDNRTYRIIKNIKFSSEDFFLENKNISLNVLKDNIFEFIIKYNEEKYISIYEKNIIFPICNDNETNLDYKANYIIEFIGSPNKNMPIILHCILYPKNNNLNKDYKVELGSSIFIKTSDSIEHFYLNIKVKGEGRCWIEGINIYECIKDNINDYKDLIEYKLNIPSQLNNFKIACIFDDFTRECFKYECTIIDIRPDSWKVDFLLYKPHLFMIESAWLGYKGLWRGIISSGDEIKIKKLLDILNWCKDNFIPTIFWNKEDPVHFNKFINIAKYFNYIFTTDKESIKEYKKIINHENVYCLMFAAQPKIHNPIRYTDFKSSKACFAGSYYKNMFPERCKELNKLLNAAMNTIGVDIYDRKYNSGLPNFEYPKEFQPFIKGYLDAENICIANKGYKVNINVNSVKDSSTMFSRRVFESLASGTPIISSFSIAISLNLKDMVFMSDDYYELENEFLKISSDEKYYYKKVIQGIRCVLNNHTYKDRLFYIINKLDYDITYNKPTLCIVSKVNNKNDIERCINIYNSQKYMFKQ